MSLTKVTYSMIDGATVNALDYGAVGDGTTDDFAALQAWQDAAFQLGQLAELPAGIYYCSDNLIIKADTIGHGMNNSQIVFAEGKGFRTYVSTTEFYAVDIKNIGFISDKSSYWNATDAGASYDSAVTRPDVKRLYGARVWKGNRTSTPNNICANDPTDKLNGTGFWEKDYAQWMQTFGVAADISLAGSISFNADTCIYYGFKAVKTISGCMFQGFDAFVVTGTYTLNIQSNNFVAMKKGILFINASYIGGDPFARVTTIGVQNNSFNDCWVGIYAADFLQGTINNENVFEPTIVGIYIGVGGAPACLIQQNNFEINHTAIYHEPNEENNGIIGPNFGNIIYTYYVLWLNFGRNITVLAPSQSIQQKIYISPDVQLSNFPAGCQLMLTQPNFLQKGNAVGRGDAKFVIYKITGVSGTSANIEVENVAGAGSVPFYNNDTVIGYLNPAIALSGANGLFVPPNIIPLKLELLNYANELIDTFPLDDPYTGNHTYFFKVFNDSTNVFDPFDFRVNEQVAYVRLTFTESSTPTLYP